MGWYHFISQQTPVDDLVLDVGAGTCQGLLPFEAKGVFAFGLETDERLRGSHNRLIIASVDDIPSKSVDVVTCLDVIEHVVEDTAFLSELLRIARRRLYVTTPNFTRSQAINLHHAREVTIPQFLRHYRPDELHVASPDGWQNRMLLVRKFEHPDLESNPGFKILKGSRAGLILWYNSVPDSLSFADTTVDGNEWAHVLGVWNLA
jgi:hypothetical protein